MTHLTDGELVDAIDRALSPARAAHLEACAACRERSDALRRATRALVEIDLGDVPEPSPLFWEHFSQRVRDAVQDMPPSAAQAGTRQILASLWSTTASIRVVSMTAAAAMVLAGVIALWNASRPTRPSPGPVTAVRTTEPTTVTNGSNVKLEDMNLEEDEEWALVRIVADDLQWDEAQEAGLDARPGSAERVALEMSSSERQALARLLEDALRQAELKRTGA